MEDTFKKFLYTGVGMVTSTIEKVQTKVNELVNEGKLTENEGRKVIDDLIEDLDNKKEEYEGKVRGFMEGVLAKFDFPTRKEVSDLEAKIAELEAKLEANKSETATTEAPVTTVPKARKRKEEN
jgi:polyhydroxyalkanoate synthesis regulator phasin